MQSRRARTIVAAFLAALAFGTLAHCSSSGDPPHGGQDAGPEGGGGDDGGSFDSGQFHVPDTGGGGRDSATDVHVDAVPAPC